MKLYRWGISYKARLGPGCYREEEIDIPIIVLGAVLVLAGISLGLIIGACR